ncbi:MAG: transporter [Nitrospiraceae bacterium]|nr:transporter [Nitrospiraceae bacterium]
MFFLRVAQVLACFTMMLSFTSRAFALYPLVTDDTGVQGKGNTQVEFCSEYSKKEEDGVKEKSFALSTTIAYGLNNSMDLIIGVPFQNIRTKTSDSVSSEDGLLDILLELKWKFHDKDGLSFALKPSITLPSGDKKRGLGNGRATYGIYFITTKEIDPLAFHFNLQYKKNENKTDSKLDIWNASIGSEYRATEKLKFCADAGVSTNESKDSTKAVSYVLGGLIYSILKDMDIETGYKHGLTKPADDRAFLAGITYRF